MVNEDGERISSQSNMKKVVGPEVEAPFFGFVDEAVTEQELPVDPILTSQSVRASMHYNNTSSVAYDPGVEEAVMWKDQGSIGSKLHCHHRHRGQTIHSRLAMDWNWEVIIVTDAIHALRLVVRPPAIAGAKYK